MTPKIKRILFATDLTKNSEYAFSFAIDLARTHDAKIVVLHTIEPLPSIGRMHEELASEKKYYEKETEITQETIKAEISADCLEMERLVGPPCVSLVSKILTPVGHPVEEILVNADEEECDIIVMATHGKGLLKHTFLGSISLSVLGRTRKPVVLIPLPAQEAGAGM
jgi:nucleotide-binding universal stress UspA family protein